MKCAKSDYPKDECHRCYKQKLIVMGTKRKDKHMLCWQSKRKRPCKWPTL